MRIGIDLMGGDSSPCTLFEAIDQILKINSKVSFVIFLTQEALDSICLSPLFPKILKSPQIEFQIATEVIGMHEAPVSAFRHKKNSSLSLGLKFLKKKYLNAFITVGSSGALIAGSTLSLPLVEDIKRPALLATFPTEKGDVAVVDVGGSVSCKASNLVQFAKLGAAYQRKNRQIATPRVGLLNIGTESKKGTNAIREAYDQLQQLSLIQHDIEFVGNIEATDVFKGKADVLVTDGFTGNILLKATQGLSHFILTKVKDVLTHHAPELSEAVLHSLSAPFDYEEYGGALVVGVESIVIKCHGKSSAKSLFNAILRALSLV